MTAAPPPPPEFGPGERKNAEALIALALAEDLGPIGDLTADATIPADATGSARFVARQPGVITGLPLLELLAEHFSLSDRLSLERRDGDQVQPGEVLARVSGPLRAILAMERTALNFLQRLSGIATLTRRFVSAVSGTRASILDTRKTTPGWRLLEKYAVRCGGGSNHRIGLFDAVLIKDNHLAWFASTDDPIGLAVSSARSHSPAGTMIEVEVDTLEQLQRALSCAPEIILLDNFSSLDLAEAVRLRDERAPSILLEASGGIRLETVSEVARSGVDRISVGALTHSAPSLDIALDDESDTHSRSSS